MRRLVLSHMPQIALGAADELFDAQHPYPLAQLKDCRPRLCSDRGQQLLYLTIHLDKYYGKLLACTVVNNLHLATYF